VAAVRTERKIVTDSGSGEERQKTVTDSDSCDDRERKVVTDSDSGEDRKKGR
jgi:hypothetical protein